MDFNRILKEFPQGTNVDFLMIFTKAEKANKREFLKEYLKGPNVNF